MTSEHRRRIIDALAETNRLLDKEMRYAPDLRKLDQIAFYESHIAKLVGYLETGAMPSWQTWTPETAQRRVGGTFGT